MADFPFGAIGNLIGGHFDREAAEDQQNRNIDMQREFAQNGISWKVADAVRAGLHPLVGAGATGSLFTPNPIVTGDMASAGQALGNAISRSADQSTREMHEAQISLLRMQAAKEFSQAAYYDSEAARNRQTVASAAPIPSLSDGGPVPGQSITKPSEVVSPSLADSSRGAGDRDPLWHRFEAWPGMFMDLPRTNDPGETLSEMGPGDIGFWLTMSRMIQQHGWERPYEILSGRPLTADGLGYIKRDVAKVLRDALGPLKELSERSGRERTYVRGRPHEYAAGYYHNPALIGSGYEAQMRANRGRYGRR